MSARSSLSSSTSVLMNSGSMTDAMKSTVMSGTARQNSM